MNIKADKRNIDSKAPKDGAKFLTIFTDASFKDGLYGTGHWYKLDKDPHTGGTFGTCKTPEEAEILGLLYAMDAILLQGFDLSEVIVVVQCDCIGALSKVSFDRLNALKVVKKHVKGHSSAGTKRTYVQRMCDSIARAKRLDFTLGLSKVVDGREDHEK